MPDVIDLLNSDHREVEMLFEQFREQQDPMTVEQICEELTVHTTVEEEIVYPVLRKADEELTQEALHEHKEARQLIEQIQALDPGDPQVVPLVEQLEQAVRHHVQEEETEAWPELRENAGDQLEDLGAKVEQRKEQLQSGGGGGGAVDDDATKEELYEQAKAAEIPGRSQMNKDELREALEQQG